ncbi:hypothetical protein Y032_0301g1842 [Ancylostoma ceylanicum]|nr:hypothetical protein Y032_0301g1842 [Ancylostoma ceylanicum]
MMPRSWRCGSGRALPSTARSFVSIFWVRLVTYRNSLWSPGVSPKSLGSLGVVSWQRKSSSGDPAGLKICSGRPGEGHAQKCGLSDDPVGPKFL